MALSAWPKGQEKEMSEWLSDMWKNLETNDVWEHWTVGLAQGILVEAGALNHQPLLTFLEDIMQKFKDVGFQRKVSVGAVDVETAQFV